MVGTTSAWSARQTGRDASMARVARGARIVLDTGTSRIPVRALREVLLVRPWVVPVLAPVRALESCDGVVEIPTDTGLFSAPAHLGVCDGALELRPGAADAPALLQRRDDVRGRVALPLRAAAADGAAERALGDAVLEGVTIDVSAGGLSIDVGPDGIPTPRGARFYLELALPEGEVVPAVVSVVQAGDQRLGARFVDIAPADTDRLARLVFRLQREELAARGRLRRDGGR
jgi:hypothetical protein